MGKKAKKNKRGDFNNISPQQRHNMDTLCGSPHNVVVEDELAERARTWRLTMCGSLSEITRADKIGKKAKAWNRTISYSSSDDIVLAEREPGPGKTFSSKKSKLSVREEKKAIARLAAHANDKAVVSLGDTITIFSLADRMEMPARTLEYPLDRNPETYQMFMECKLGTILQNGDEKWQLIKIHKVNGTECSVEPTMERGRTLKPQNRQKVKCNTQAVKPNVAAVSSILKPKINTSQSAVLGKQTKNAVAVSNKSYVRKLRPIDKLNMVIDCFRLSSDNRRAYAKRHGVTEEEILQWGNLCMKALK